MASGINFKCFVSTLGLKGPKHKVLRMQISAFSVYPAVTRVRMNNLRSPAPILSCFFWQIYNTTFHEIFMILQQKIFIDTWPFAWVGFNSKEHRHDRASSSVLNKFKKIGNFSLPGFGLKNVHLLPKGNLISFMCKHCF